MIEKNLRPIKPERISDQVFNQVKELILRNELKPGEKLMPEKEMAKALDVSKTTVINALNKLITLGLLVHRKGEGIYVPSLKSEWKKNPLTAAMITQESSLLELLEVRMGLECNAAYMAAQRANETDLVNLEKSLVESEQDIANGSWGAGGDTAFHMSIAFATKNQFHIHIMKYFYDLLFTSIKENLIHLVNEIGNLEKVYEHHREIYQSIRKRKARQAYDCMRTHIKHVIDFYQVK